jgi:OmpA-OmpF porin, OOP family
VPNPGFETYSSCPTGFSQLFQATPWNDPNTGTSDAYNQCSPGGFPSVNVPANTFGYQNAHGGVGYAGVLMQNFNDYREYLQAPLTSSLVAASTYYVEFWVSLSDTSNGATDRLGAHFSNGPISVGNFLPLAGTPQVESPVNVYLNDTDNWMKVSGTFVAAGGENHNQIGNFHDDATTNIQPMASAYPGINYYVDDILVELVNPNVDQACCLPDGSCQTTTPGECQLLGGTPLGAGTSCGDDPCSPTSARKTSWGAVKGTYR